MTLDQKALEAAARAIYEDRNGKGCKPWSLLPNAHKAPYLSDARAALLAYGDAERARLARMIEAMVTETPWADNMNSRMALAIAASNVRRGRTLTAAEKFDNLTNAIEEDDPELADWLRSMAAQPVGSGQSLADATSENPHAREQGQ